MDLNVTPFNMNLMDKYEITFETWNKLALLYQEKFMDIDIYDGTYDRFCQLAGMVGHSILEIGCGPGNITRHMVSYNANFNITAVDVAPEMVKLAKANNPTVTVEVMDCRNLTGFSDLFDGIIAGFCIPYLSNEDCSDFIKACTFLLQPLGILYISAIKGDYSKSGFESGSTGNKAFVYYYDEAFFETVFEKNGLKILNKFEIEYKAQHKPDQIHLVYIAQKSSLQ